MENEKIYLTKENAEEIKKELERLQKVVREIGKQKGELKIGLSSEGNYEDIDYEFSKAEFERLNRKVLDLRLILENAIIVKAEQDSTRVNVGNIVTAKITYAEDDIEDATFKLVAALDPNFDSEIPEITLKSPIGNAVYGKMIGERVSINGIGAFAEVLDINYSKENTPKEK